jgi:hypothetical protein
MGLCRTIGRRLSAKRWFREESSGPPFARRFGSEKGSAAYDGMFTGMNDASSAAAR